MNKINESHTKLAKEILSPVMHLSETDSRFQEYVEAVAKRLAKFERDILDRCKVSEILKCKNPVK